MLRSVNAGTVNHYRAILYLIYKLFYRDVDKHGIIVDFNYILLAITVVLVVVVDSSIF